LGFRRIDAEKASVAEHFSLVEFGKIWDINHDEARPSTIVAGLAIFLYYNMAGRDTTGWQYMAQAEYLADVLGLFRPALFGSTYSPEPQHVARTKNRQTVAWGLFNFRA
jgi:hypothetical protein